MQLEIKLNLRCETKLECLPCLCSWGRRSDRWAETCQIPASSDCWSAGKTGNNWIFQRSMCYWHNVATRVKDCTGDAGSTLHSSQCLHMFVITVTYAKECAYSPRLVAEVVDGVQRVDRGDAGILQTDDQVLKILVLGHAEGVLTHQHKVWPERSGLKGKNS